jgi:phosphatidate cytidylyltransferase
MLKQRIMTAVIAALLLFAILFALPPQLARGIIACLLIIGAWEWSGFLNTGSTGRTIFVAVIAGMIVSVFLGMVPADSVKSIFQLALIWWVMAFIWTFFFPTSIPRPVAWFSGILVIVPAYVALDWLYQISPWVLLFMLLIVWLADIGAYFAGKAFGRVKLAPKISPGKTWEGAIGGLSAVILLVVIESIWLDFPVASVIPLAMAVGVISVIGDLTVSMFKRTAGVKDSGSLFPGHGGFLDRADAITAAAPVFSLGLIWLGPSILGLPV